MRRLRFSSLVAFVALLLVGGAIPSWATPPSRTQTVNLSVAAVCNATLETQNGEPVTDIPPPGPFPVNLPVTATVPTRAHSGRTLQVSLTIGMSSNNLEVHADVSGAPGVTPPVKRLEVFGGSPLSGSLTFTATGKSGTTVQWQLDDFGARFTVVDAPNHPEPLIATLTCTPNDETNLGATRLLGGPTTR